MATGDDIQMPWGSWGIGVSKERRKDGIWFKVRLCLYRRSHFLGRFEDPFIARLAYDAAIRQLRPGSRTNYDRRFFELTDAAALDKVQVFVLKTEQQYGKSKPAVKALVDSLLAALASLGQVLAGCGATPCSSISEEMVAGWLAGLQQLAAKGSAADVSVLQLCSALAAEPYAGL
ncbi:hypothetical protein OEZ86_010191 [Tetradesmus obliquus]|nr:hypothetical protein OEZ86_010191 [Tetradesmus obliquus]